MTEHSCKVGIFDTVYNLTLCEFGTSEWTLFKKPKYIHETTCHENSSEMIHRNDLPKPNGVE